MHKMQVHMLSPSSCLDTFQYRLKIQGRKVTGCSELLTSLVYASRTDLCPRCRPMAHNTSSALQKHCDIFLSQNEKQI